MKSRIFEPIVVNKTTVRNRIALPAMSSRLAAADGSVTDKLIRYYEDRARGGAGMVIVEYAFVDKLESKAAICQLGVHDDNMLPGLNELAEAIKAQGACAILQMAHGGGQSIPTIIGGRTPLTPSPMFAVGSGEIRALTTAEATLDQIEGIIESFGEAAARAEKAGFDGIEVHSAHGYLLSQFLSPRANKRNDIYGPTFEERVRFVLRIMKRIKDSVSDNFIVGIRYNVADCIEGGIPAEEGVQFSIMLEEAGVHYLDSSSCTYENHDMCIPTTFRPRGSMRPLGKMVKEAVNSIVVLAGGGVDHNYASKMLEEDNLDMIWMGRALIADPDAPNKMMNNKYEDVRPCIRCNEGCLGRFFKGGQMRCSTNPFVGREALAESLMFMRSQEKKKVVVVGGGPAGLEAARVSKELGHDVTLFEKSDHIGGNAAIACIPSFKKDIEELLDWYKHTLKNLGVEVKLGESASADKIKKMAPDVIFVATGSSHLKPNVSGVDGANVVTASDVLTGKAPIANGKKVAIVGSGLVGIETALHMHEQGMRGIQVIEMRDEAYEEIISINKLTINEMLAKTDIQIKTSAKVCSFDEKGLSYIDADKNIQHIDADAVVLAVGFVPENGVFEELKNICPKVYRVGDCRKVGLIYDAVESGAWTALEKY